VCCFSTVFLSGLVLSSCDWGVKGVGNQIAWYFRDHSQTNHKLTGTPYLCMMYVRRGSNYVCLNDTTKMSEGWVNQSRINRTFRVLCVLFFNFFFSGSVCLFWNRLDDLWWGRIPSARVYKCLEHSQHTQPPLKLKFLVIGGSKA
jgi:hypothetical protein